MTGGGEKHVVHWFRKGLRLHDNPTLKAGLKGATTFRGIFIIDPWFAGSSNVGINKWRRIYACHDNLGNSNTKNMNNEYHHPGQSARTLPKHPKNRGRVICTVDGSKESIVVTREEEVCHLPRRFDLGIIKIRGNIFKFCRPRTRCISGISSTIYPHLLSKMADSLSLPWKTLNIPRRANNYENIKGKCGDKCPNLRGQTFKKIAFLFGLWPSSRSSCLFSLTLSLAWLLPYGPSRSQPPALYGVMGGIQCYAATNKMSVGLWRYFPQASERYGRVCVSLVLVPLHYGLSWHARFGSSCPGAVDLWSFGGMPVHALYP
ncbi:unnamed protein product, partial [Meganyctiphanes norvegica]